MTHDCLGIWEDVIDKNWHHKQCFVLLYGLRLKTHYRQGTEKNVKSWGWRNSVKVHSTFSKIQPLCSWTKRKCTPTEFIQEK